MFKALILGMPISYAVAILLVFVLVFTTMMYSVSRVNKSNIVDTLKMDTM